MKEQFKPSPCTRCRRDQTTHTPCSAYYNWAALWWAKIQHRLGGKPLPGAAEIYRRARAMAKAGEAGKGRG